MSIEGGKYSGRGAEGSTSVLGTEGFRFDSGVPDFLIDAGVAQQRGGCLTVNTFQYGPFV